ncbi:hypothetical protein HUW46_08752 [Amycolatopsis sp. CA-230715]|nr:hypothetical protein HUW46_08752 [Amycolatopsis sp. CA-230715]
MIALCLRLAHRLATCVLRRREAPTAKRTRVVLDEAYGYEHVEPLTPNELADLL